MYNKVEKVKKFEHPIVLWCKPFLSYVEKHRGEIRGVFRDEEGLFGLRPPTGPAKSVVLKKFFGLKIPEYTLEGMPPPPTWIGLNCEHV